jgi:hypothetical protein
LNGVAAGQEPPALSPKTPVPLREPLFSCPSGEGSLKLCRFTAAGRRDSRVRNKLRHETAEGADVCKLRSCCARFLLPPHCAASQRPIARRPPVVNKKLKKSTATEARPNDSAARHRGSHRHMNVDVQGKRLLMAALGNQTVEVVDLAAGKRLQSITGLERPEGLV